MLAKAETLDFQEAEDLIKGLRPIDPQRDLTTPVSGAARAFEFHDEWTLPVTITRYELEEVKRTSIDRAVCRMVLTPAGEIAVQAVYRVRSVRPRLTVKLPPNASPDLDPFRINGQPVTLQKGPGRRVGRALADGQRRGAVRAGDPLYGDGRKDVFAARRSSTKRPRKRSISAPSCRPPGRRGHGRIVGRGFRVAVGKPGPLGAGQLGIRMKREVEWVCEGNNGALGAAKTFHVDGTPLIFSTLRPDPQTNVRLWTIDHETLNAWIFGVVLLAVSCWC